MKHEKDFSFENAFALLESYDEDDTPQDEWERDFDRRWEEKFGPDRTDVYTPEDFFERHRQMREFK